MTAPPHPRLLRFARKSFEPLVSNTAHQHAARYALCLYGANAVYSFIPKNACSTMRYSFALANGAITEPDEFYWIHHNNETFRASLRDLATAAYSFVILRDPYLRLASCFLDKLVGSEPVVWNFHQATKYRIAPERLSFRDFVSALKPILRANEHWRPQTDFLVYEQYDDYFCVEDFAAAERRLRERIGLDVKDARGLTRHGADQFTALEDGTCHADTPAHEIAAMKRGGKLPAARQLYDPALAEQVTTLYAGDIWLYQRNIGRSCIF